MCTVFNIMDESNNKLFVGKNYDVKGKYRGMIFVNNPNIRKKAYLEKEKNPVMWESKYGSVTFSQFSKEFPNSGMNEMGLVVEQDALLCTKYPEADERPAIKELQWIQYMLDTCKSVDEVLEKTKELRVAETFATVMYYICDRTGKHCAIQYISGEEQIINQEKLKYGTLTNDTYETCLQYLGQHKGYGGEKEITYTTHSMDRYVTTVDTIQKLDKREIDVTDIFNILELTKFRDTKWQIVYMPREKKIYFKSQKTDKMLLIDMNEMNFEEKETKTLMDIDAENVQFEEFKEEIICDLMKHFLRKLMLLYNIKGDQSEQFAELIQYVKQQQE